MICVNCDNEVTIENELGLCHECNENFIGGLVGYTGNEDDNIRKMVKKFDEVDNGKRYTLDEVLEAEG